MSMHFRFWLSNDKFGELHLFTENVEGISCKLMKEIEENDLHSDISYHESFVEEFKIDRVAIISHEVEESFEDQITALEESMDDDDFEFPTQEMEFGKIIPKAHYDEDNLQSFHYGEVKLTKDSFVANRHKMSNAEKLEDGDGDGLSIPRNILYNNKLLYELRESKGYQYGDDFGHIQPYWLGGDFKEENIMMQNREVNKILAHTFENKLAHKLSKKLANEDYDEIVVRYIYTLWYADDDSTELIKNRRPIKRRDAYSLKMGDSDDWIDIIFQFENPNSVNLELYKQALKYRTNPFIEFRFKDQITGNFKPRKYPVLVKVTDEDNQEFNTLYCVICKRPRGMGANAYNKMRRHLCLAHDPNARSAVENANKEFTLFQCMYYPNCPRNYACNNLYVLRNHYQGFPRKLKLDKNGDPIVPKKYKGDRKTHNRQFTDEEWAKEKEKCLSRLSETEMKFYKLTMKGAKSSGLSKEEFEEQKKELIDKIMEERGCNKDQDKDEDESEVSSDGSSDVSSKVSSDVSSKVSSDVSSKVSSDGSSEASKEVSSDDSNDVPSKAPSKARSKARSKVPDDDLSEEWSDWSDVSSEVTSEEWIEDSSDDSNEVSSEEWSEDEYEDEDEVGKIIASAAIMCGVLVLALPITIIVDNFIKVAQDEQQAEQQKLDQPNCTRGNIALLAIRYEREGRERWREVEGGGRDSQLVGRAAAGVPGPVPTSIPVS
ncbi:hypothetical protein WR25_19631 isoform C [Diploscapter pachys]|nr:hypothetical protein WR25_19631 isoform C [Diploscapter pachys]